MRNLINARFAASSGEWAMSRREFLMGTAAGATALALTPAFIRQARAAEPAINSAANASATPPVELSVVHRSIEVNGRAANVYGIQQPDGTHGIRLREGDAFNVVLRNQTAEPTVMHWHGLIPPSSQDGAGDVSMPSIDAGAQVAFNFPVGSAGTYWMHAHTLQEQQLLAAPLIVTDAGQAKRDEQEVVILLHDFSFKSPEELLAGLNGAGHESHDSDAMYHDAMPMKGMHMSGSDGAMGSMMASMPGMQMGGAAMPMDLNDIDYDAYLANDRTLDDPEVVRVENGSRVRVRVINGATATAFTIDLGNLQGTLIAVDGQPVQPVTGRRFPLTMGQRIDVLLQLPRDSRAFPILALREGSEERTGIILQPKGARISKVASKGRTQGPVLDLALESRLRAAAPLASRQRNKAFDMALTGDMAAYRWGQETHPRLAVDGGNRVEVTMRNTTMMAHPMHLHGHRFQVVAIDGRRFAGAMRDTVLVPPRRSVAIAIDADNPGQWPFHCHHLYHMARGMMTMFAYNV